MEGQEGRLWRARESTKGDTNPPHGRTPTIKRYEIEWIGREGLAPETHEEYLNDFINHFYKNVLKLIGMLKQ